MTAIPPELYAQVFWVWLVFQSGAEATLGEVKKALAVVSGKVYDVTRLPLYSIEDRMRQCVECLQVKTRERAGGTPVCRACQVESLGRKVINFHDQVRGLAYDSR